MESKNLQSNFNTGVRKEKTVLIIVGLIVLIIVGFYVISSNKRDATSAPVGDLTPPPEGSVGNNYPNTPPSQ